MNLLGQSNILGDTHYTIELLRVHASGGWCEILLEIEKRSRDHKGVHLLTPMGGMTRCYASIHHKKTRKKKEDSKQGQIKAGSDNGYYFMTGGRGE